MGCNSISRVVVRMKITKKKKNKETGAIEHVPGAIDKNPELAQAVKPLVAIRIFPWYSSPLTVR